MLRAFAGLLALNRGAQERRGVSTEFAVDPLRENAPLSTVDADDLSRLEGHFAQRRFADAERLARSLICCDPVHPFAWKILAASVAAMGDRAQAIALYENAPVSVLADWQFHNNFGNLLKTCRQLPSAAAQYRRALALSPRALEPQYSLAVTLLEMGDLQEAERCLRAVLMLDAAHGLSHVNLGNILQGWGRLPEAEMHYECALLTMPDDPRLLNNYGQLLQRQHRYGEAEGYYRRAIDADAAFAPACVNLAELLGAHGLLAEAERLLRHALTLDPELVKGHSNLLFVLALRENCDAATLYVEHLAFSDRFEAPLKPHWPEHANTRDPHRMLRVGFVSGDLRDHPVVRYLMPALQHLRQRGDLELYAYNCGLQADGFTARYKGLFHRWRDVTIAPDADVARRIEADGIDILIDLAGHSGDNRMLTFARKPAPVQMSWMGYVGTTGLEAMDYFIGDLDLVPQEAQAMYREKILYLPATTTFQPYEPALPPNVLPALANGFVTFCCLARINKLNRPLIAMWSRVLRALPTSRMLLLTIAGGGVPSVVLEWFVAEGVAADRLTFVRARSVEDILRLHHEADIGMDTFPYNGSTTISHALTMGVPTLTLQGSCPASRLGCSINAKVGLDEFVARDDEEFVQSALYWAEHVEELAALREALPQRFAGSVLCQHGLVYDMLVVKLRQAWVRWCSGMPPAHL